MIDLVLSFCRMVKIALQMKAILENVTDLQPEGTDF